MRGEPCRRWQNTTLRLNFGCPRSTQMRDSCPVVMRSRFITGGASLGQRPTSPMTWQPGVVWIHDERVGAQSPHIWLCGSDRRRSQLVCVLRRPGRLWRKGRGYSCLKGCMPLGRASLCPAFGRSWYASGYARMIYEVPYGGPCAPTLAAAVVGPQHTPGRAASATQNIRVQVPRAGQRLSLVSRPRNC